MSGTNPSESAHNVKVQSLLAINKTLAKENTFLSQQLDVLSRECVSLVRLVIGRTVLPRLSLYFTLRMLTHALTC